MGGKPRSKNRRGRRREGRGAERRKGNKGKKSNEEGEEEDEGGLHDAEQEHEAVEGRTYVIKQE